ncbi:hypothetical protein E4T47_00988 [Aureobasidium subglaciale]|nr:hypothetical protein E4T43_00579 [Aureobasidium subglaciale]KAI5276194.1 hypothetical protein E4T47_00988 [Aureobasidium subglaciale]
MAHAHTKQGKRKSASKPEGKKKCLFCNHENSVSVKIDKKASTGELTCKVCGQTFQTVTNCTSSRERDMNNSCENRLNIRHADLSAPIDVYSDWVDACDSVAKQAAQSTSQSRRDSYSGTASQSNLQGSRNAAPADDGFIDDDELDAEADYAEE